MNDVSLTADGTVFAVSRQSAVFKAPLGGTFTLVGQGFEELSDQTNDHYKAVIPSPDYEQDGTVWVGAGRAESNWPKNLLSNPGCRLRAGATAAEATRDLSAVMQRDVIRDFPNFEGWSVLVEPFHEASVMARWSSSQRPTLP